MSLIKFLKSVDINDCNGTVDASKVDVMEKKRGVWIKMNLAVYPIEVRVFIGADQPPFTELTWRERFAAKMFAKKLYKAARRKTRENELKDLPKC